MTVQDVFDTRVRPPFRSFAGVSMVTEVDPANYTMRKLTVPPSIAAGANYDLFLEEVREAGVGRVLVSGRAGVAMGPTPANQDVLALIDEDPVLYAGAPAMDTDAPEKAAAELVELKRNGVVGVIVEPGLAATPRYLDDPVLDPIWGACETLGLPALVMCGGVCGPDLSWADPLHLDRLAARWQGVKFVAVKGGHPYVLPMLTVALQRKNVWVSPDLWMCNMPGATPYVEAANTFLADRLLYGSAYPWVGLRESLDVWSSLPFDDAVRPRVFRENAEQLFGVG